MTTLNPVPSLLNITIERAAANLDKYPTLTFLPDHIVAILFEKTLEACKLNDSLLKKFLETDNSWVRKRVKDLGIRPVNRPVLPTVLDGGISRQNELLACWKRRNSDFTGGRRNFCGAGEQYLKQISVLYHCSRLFRQRESSPIISLFMRCSTLAFLRRKKMKGSSALRVAGGSVSLWVQQWKALSSTACRGELSLGTKYSQKCSFSAADVTSYCRLTGDSNPIHSSTSAALEAGFSGCVVPGMLCGSLFPAIIGSRFAGAVYVSQTLTFKTPLAVDESIIAEVEVTAIKNLRRKAKITFTTRCFTEEKERFLIDGESIALLPYLIKDSG
ncbi:hypothetical protein R1flu_028071 [Riccia fluitans]|uniref:MaoC-like domain-containing protein n=1 Tax=Riccia fluitans TaxID=41844 RepID=A0ABD1XLA7_9MARC